MGCNNLAYSEKVNLQVPIKFSFQGIPLFLGKETLTKVPTLQQDVTLSILP